MWLMTNFLQTLTRHTEPLARLPHETRYAFINQSHPHTVLSYEVWRCLHGISFPWSDLETIAACLCTMQKKQTSRHVCHAKRIEPYAKSGSCTKTNAFGTIKSMFFLFLFLFFRILRFPKCRHPKQNPCWSVNVVLKCYSERGNC